MRIISWNVNGIRAVEKRGFAEWLAAENPDVLCVQETKATPEQLAPSLVSPPDKDGKPYKSYWASAKKKGYSGTAIYTKEEPKNTGFLDDERFDGEGRVLYAEFPNVTVISAYFPNSQDAGARLGYKLDFCAAMLDYCKKLVKQKKNFVLCGDYNIAHTPIDLARPKDNEGNAGYLPEERAWMDKWTSSGFCDTFRHFHPGEAGHYSWWSYRMKARERNIGWRIDYHCVNEDFMPAVKSSVIRSEVMGSDHCPIQLDLDIGLVL
ncbi:MAG: exodeoxyribonuclease III [Spirochaetaceae bacterium]|jgi:exodeoxyribonuclease-3|nr:exodeoxyribonuclease III [Spirochaetaceae bacterium]